MAEVEPTAVVGVPGATPVPVTVTGPIPAAGPAVQQQQHDPSIPARTTFQEDLTFAGQRQVNLIWESTQGQIARFVIFGTVFIDGAAALLSIGLTKEITAAQALLIGSVNALATGVISFYFSRTNHTQIGGVGAKPSEPYQGR